MKLGPMIRAARRQAGLSQRALAELCVIPQSTVARIESGVLNPRTDTAEKILGALGLELAPEPRLGRGVDRTLIHHMLAMTPGERIRYAASAGLAGRRLRERTSVR